MNARRSSLAVAILTVAACLASGGQAWALPPTVAPTTTLPTTITSFDPTTSATTSSTTSSSTPPTVITTLSTLVSTLATTSGTTPSTTSGTTGTTTTPAGGSLGTAGQADKVAPHLSAAGRLSAKVKNGVFTVVFNTTEAGSWQGLTYTSAGSSSAIASRKVLISSAKKSSSKAGKVKMKFKLNKKGKALFKKLKKRKKKRTSATVRLKGKDKAGNASPTLVRVLTLKR